MAKKRVPGFDLPAIISRMGASIDHVEDNGQVDFDLDDIPGFAHVEDGALRLSFFIAWDPEPTRARTFGKFLIVHGDVEVIELPDGTALRFLVTLPVEDVPEDQGWARDVAAEARGLRRLWEDTPQDEEMVESLTAAGIAAPHLGSRQIDELRTFGPWHWGTRYIDPRDLYSFNVDLVASVIAKRGHLFAMSHAGHGWNSYGLNLVTGQGPIAVFVQHGYGGSFMRPISAQMDINSSYARIATLFDATRARHNEPPRWLLYRSDFRGASGILDLQSINGGDVDGSPGIDLEFEQSYLAMAEFDRDDESRLFSKAAELLGDVAPFNDRD